MDNNKRAVIPAAMRRLHERSHYSPGLVVGRTLYIAGQVGRDEELNVIHDPRQQYERAFENLGLVLAEAGASPSDVVDITTFHTEFDDITEFREMKNQFFSVEPYPTWTAIGVAKLVNEGLRVEIKCIAVLPT